MSTDRPTYYAHTEFGHTFWKTSDGSTFATEADARLHADPAPTTINGKAIDTDADGLRYIVNPNRHTCTDTDERGCKECAYARELVAPKSKLRTIEDRLTAQGASLATIDSYSAEVRHTYAAAIARTLREVVSDLDYDLGDVDPKIMARIADQIERMA